MRLLPNLGAARFERVPPPATGAEPSFRLGGRRHQTRPAIRLRPGQRRSCEVDVVAGTRLSFAHAFLGLAAGRQAKLEVRAAGRLVYSVRSRLDLPASFATATVPLRAEGRILLEFSADVVKPPRQGSERTSNTDAVVLVGSPRLYHPRAAKRRVLIWISQDTVRADHLGPYGYERSTSPTFDHLAADWIVFDDAMATAPWTLPSLVSQFTGRYPGAHGAVLETTSRDPRHPSLFQILALEGFTVLGVTGNRFLSADFLTADGFDALWFTPNAAAEVTTMAGRLVEEWGGGDLALVVHYMDPHYPYEPPAPFDDLFDAGYKGSVDGHSFRRIPPKRARAKDVARVKALYDGELAYTDEQIARLLAMLRARGLTEDALMVYSADHGEAFLEHGKWLHTRTLYQELLHVPLALHAPGLPSRRVTRPVSLVDLAPTLLDLLDIEVPASFLGRSLKPLLQGRGLSEEPLFAETEQTHELKTRKVAVRLGRLKYIAVTPREGSGPPPVLREELYDLEHDPAELHPLPLLQAGRFRRLVQQYLARTPRGNKGSRRVLLAPEDREALRALGYIQ